MRPLFALTLVPLLGCSNLLGIQDPSTGDDAGSGSGSGDAGIDAMVPPSGDIVKISLQTVTIAQQQLVRIKVSVVHTKGGGGSDDITGSAMLQLHSSSDGVATIGSPLGGAATVAGVAAGATTITASYPNAAPATLGVTVTAKTCHPVINELSTGAATGLDEFVEIYNPCNTTIDVSTWTLDYRAKTTIAGADDSSILVALAGMMSPGEVRLYSGSGYTGGGTVILPKWTSGISSDGAVGLRNGPKSMGAVVDAVGFGTSADPTFVEGTILGAIGDNLTDARVGFDGNDNDNNKTDFSQGATAQATPGALNFP